jgi:hypothetical protein
MKINGIKVTTQDKYGVGFKSFTPVRRVDGETPVQLRILVGAEHGTLIKYYAIKAPRGLPLNLLREFQEYCVVRIRNSSAILGFCCHIYKGYLIMKFGSIQFYHDELPERIYIL